MKSAIPFGVPAQPSPLRRGGGEKKKPCSSLGRRVLYRYLLEILLVFPGSTIFCKVVLLIFADEQR